MNYTTITFLKLCQTFPNHIGRPRIYAQPTSYWCIYGSRQRHKHRLIVSIKMICGCVKCMSVTMHQQVNIVTVRIITSRIDETFTGPDILRSCASTFKIAEVVSVWNVVLHIVHRYSICRIRQSFGGPFPSTSYPLFQRRSQKYWHSLCLSIGSARWFILLLSRNRSL